MPQTQFNIEEIFTNAKNLLSKTWQKIDEIKAFNQIKVLEAFREVGIQNSHYQWVTGYGYDDLGKEKLDELYATCFKAEAALVRPQLVSGTHAISCAILGALNAGDEFICLGKPYDTLETVFSKFVLKYKLNFKKNEEITPTFVRTHNEKTFTEYLRSTISSQTKLVSIQRSRGYEWRESFCLAEITMMIAAVKTINPNIVVFVDNCYGEFTQTQEPIELGADLMAGSLIKNPGAGIVAAGGYIAGKKDLVLAASEVMTAPGIANHGGCMFDQTRLMYQGFYLAPLIVSEALKGMSLAAKIFTELGLETNPGFDSERNDIIQATKFGSPEKLIGFCKLIQNYCPVNSMFSPIPCEISGYDDQVIMASGSFIEGSSIELSADGPLREPYIGYLQGGLSYAHTEYVLKKIVENI